MRRGWVAPRGTLASLAVALAGLWPPTQPADAHWGRTWRVSVRTGGLEAHGPGPLTHTAPDAITPDGRFVLMTSNLDVDPPKEEAAWVDVSVADQTTGEVSRVSVSSTGEQAKGHSMGLGISVDGRYVAFKSTAANLIPNDVNGVEDVFLRDRRLGRTERVSLSSTGAQGNGGSNWGGLSADGRYVVFASTASNLVPGDTNGVSDVFLRDRETGTTSRLSVSTGGSEANSASEDPAMSADGRRVAFASFASNLVSGDSNAAADVFVRDTVEGTTARVSLTEDGGEGDSHSLAPVISGDGSTVAFTSFATNLVANDGNENADAFAADVETGAVQMISVAAPNSTRKGGGSSADGLSTDGRRVSFTSEADNLVPEDENGFMDVFIRDPEASVTIRVSVTSLGQEGMGDSFSGILSGDGRYVAFASDAWNLVDDDNNNAPDVFVRDRYDCPSGVEPDGPVSGPVHRDGEPAAEHLNSGPQGIPLRSTLRTTACSIVVPAGL